MTPAALVLQRGLRRLVARAETLEQQLDTGGESAWTAYCRTLDALARVTSCAESRGALLTSRELADAMNVSLRTVRRRKKAGALTPVLGHGKRGSALRWKAEA